MWRIEHVQAALDTALDAVIGINSLGQIAYWSSRAAEIFGWSRDEALSRDLADLIMPMRYREAHRRGLHHYLATGEGPILGRRIEIEALRRDGTEFPIELTVSAYQHGAATTFTAFVRDITERKRIEEMVRTLHAELEQRVADRTVQLEIANKELEAFSYSVSHDLRAPLRHIDGFSQALLSEYSDRVDAQGQDYLLRIRHATLRMADLIDALLKLSRVTRAGLHRTEVNLSTLASEVLHNLQRENPERRVECLVQHSVMANGDPQLLRIVLENLLSNAWKFTSKEPLARVEFGVTTVDGHTPYFVRDNGAGFDMTYAEKLFTAFQRLHSATEFPGIGVGLATVSRIVHRHGGRVWAEAAAGKGATFFFALPTSA